MQADLGHGSGPAWPAPRGRRRRSGRGRRGPPPGLPVSGLRGEAEGDPRLIDVLQGLLGPGCGRPLGLEPLVEVLAG